MLHARQVLAQVKRLKSELQEYARGIKVRIQVGKLEDARRAEPA